MRNIKDKLKYAIIWLSRINKCRGFGVQSPTAYSFIRYVINEHYPYYAYGDMDIEYPDLSWKELKLYRLYFRIANYSQADTWLLNGVFVDALLSYVKAGCNKVRFTHDNRVVSEAGVILIKGMPNNEVLDYYLINASSKSMIIIENIHASKDVSKKWNAIVADSRVGRTFDLYFCGIALMDKEKCKQHYVVNF